MSVRVGFLIVAQRCGWRLLDLWTLYSTTATCIRNDLSSSYCSPLVYIGVDAT